jgi:hypothetical protein
MTWLSAASAWLVGAAGCPAQATANIIPAPNPNNARIFLPGLTDLNILPYLLFSDWSDLNRRARIN